MLRRPLRRRGRIEIREHVSKRLRENPLGDPHVRPLAVYLPPDYDRERSRRYPTLFLLAGFTGSGPSHLAWRNFTENLPERIDRLITERRMPPAIVAFPDLFTSLGGNQYINAPAIGPYADHLTKELVPFVERTWRALPGRDHRGILGKSSGGYGAIVHGMKYASTWGAVACHSGDMYFEYAYLPEFPRIANALAPYGRSIDRFLKAFRAKEKHGPNDIHALMGIAMAASYDPDPKAPMGFRLPFDPRTGAIDRSRWARWLRHDPVRMAARYARNLRSLRALYIDCGSRDQYHLHYGARQLTDQLKRLRIPHRYEEFDDDHSAIDYRMDVSLPFLTRALGGRRG